MTVAGWAEVGPRARVLRPAASRPVAVVLAVVTAGAWALAAPPRGWWLLVPLGAAALTLALHGRRWRARLLLGALVGLVHYLWVLVWLADFAVPGYVAVALLEAAMLAVALALVPTAGTGRVGGWWALGPVLALLEAVQARFPFGGFPLPAVSLSQVDGPFALAAGLGGSVLVTGLAATSGVALAVLVLDRRRLRPVEVGVATALVALIVALGAAVSAATTAPAGVLDAALVQGGGPRGLPAVRSDPRVTTDRQFAVAAGITGSPDLVLLPENVITVAGSIAGSATDARVAGLARALDASVVAGVVETEGAGFRNAAVLWGPTGPRLGRYDKEHRVPFGEYVPGRGLLERVTDLTSLVPRDALVGRGEALLTTPAGPLGVAISYEVLFADRVREGVAAGGQVVLVPTNAASYVTEQVPAIEVAAARLRAREFGRTVLQAAPTGYSAIILPTGDVVAQSALEVPALLRDTVPRRTGLTPYARAGDLPWVALAGAALLAPGLGHARRSRSRRSASPP